MEKVMQYYSQFDEWARLDSAAGQIEFLRTLSLIRTHIPAGSSILDLGGGPGRYSIELAKLGFQPQLVDLSPKLVETAKEKIAAQDLSHRMAAPKVGSATQLNDFRNESFDSVIALGPFYHLVNVSDRIAAVGECYRVLKRGGLFIAAFIPKLSGVAGLLYRAAYAPHQVQCGVMEQTYRTGVFRNSSDQGFQEGYYMSLVEARGLFASSGFSELQTVSVKGLFAGREEWAIKAKHENPELFDEMLRIVTETASDASVVEMSDHALFIGRKS